MIQKYSFSNESESICFDDEKPVKELISAAFEKFGYYEPFGINIVTLFQAHYPGSTEGWFTRDIYKPCKEEIIGDKYWLCFAYYMPNVFYYAEGGWGHHMISMKNHPEIDSPVMLHLRFDDFDNTVVFNGNLSFKEVVELFKSVEYIPQNARRIVVHVINPSTPSVEFKLSDAQMNLPLVEFEKELPVAVTVIDIL